MLTRSSDSKTPQATPLRRSPRLLNLKTSIKSLDFGTRKPNSQENPSSSTAKISKKLIQSSNGSKNRVNSTPGLRRSPRLNSGSSSKKPEGSELAETKNVESNKEKEISVGVTVQRSESERRDVGIKSKRKRKREEKAVYQGWTREQEFGLQRAYFSVKPTPNFWKRVSKLVPGKSAQDCFDRIHSDQLTPNQPKPRFRAKRTNFSDVEPLSFSASKILNPSARRSKSYLAKKKTVRHLLRKHCLVDEGNEADLFSVLEPEISPSMHVVPKVVFSTPKNLLEKQGFLHNCHERSSGSKKQQSKLGNSCTRAPLVSPPVLKQIKNRALHEKYIDQLHNREAKRKVECARAEKLVGKETKGSTQTQVDKVKEAKNALVSDARYVINELQHLQTTSVDSSLDLDNDEDDVSL